jgi:DNA topoisomerase-1
LPIKMSESKLLVVESPTKARTIGKYLGKEFEVIATVGHLRDLPGSKMGVDLKTFEVDYEVDSKKKKVVAELVAAAKRSKEILLATDPDREGEAIAWHVQWLMENSKQKIDKNKISRISFHEITKEAVEEAMKNKGEVNTNLVNAQQGRRVLDRVVGYTLSPVLWKKVRRGLSAGRVQSVAVRLICEREVEIEKFTKEQFFKILALIKAKTDFGAELVKIGDKKVTTSTKIDLFDGSYTYSRSVFKDRKEADEFVKSLGNEFLVDKIESREVERYSLPPYTTSKLQQAAARRMGWSGKQTMSVAQKLYEQGLITYHRTDSVYLSPKAIEEFRKYIEKKYGANYVSSKVRVFKNTSKNAQEAHEAIRPTGVENTGASLEGREKKLYEMIWKRAVGTQAAAAKMKNTTVTLSNGKGVFTSNGVNILFDGFWKISGEIHEDQILPELAVGQKLTSQKVWVEESETNPPPRYSDASLVSSLEKQGIGRPSTYAPIISTILARQYVDKDEGKFKPTSLGVAVNLFLVKNFLEVLSLPFTADMEEDLDEVALGKLNWQSMMKKFWGVFEVEVKKVEKDAERVKVEAEKTGEKCPDCKDGELVIRLGRFGKFISCDKFPECKFTRPYKEIAGFKCPECGGDGVVRRTKTGRKFFGCSNWPKCKWAGWKKP